jgi:hypothetical protein
LNFYFFSGVLFSKRIFSQEFRAAFGRDPDILFDKYDQDKSSFLNVTEIEAVITELGIPRQMKKTFRDGGMATIGDFWVREIGIYCTCWWYSLCNFQYRQHYENTCSYNFDC